MPSPVLWALHSYAHRHTETHSVHVIKNESRAWKDGLVIKSTCLAEDEVQFPAPSLVAHNHLLTSVSDDSVPSLASSGTRHILGTDI